MYGYKQALQDLLVLQIRRRPLLALREGMPVSSVVSKSGDGCHTVPHPTLADFEIAVLSMPLLGP